MCETRDTLADISSKQHVLKLVTRSLTNQFRALTEAIVHRKELENDERISAGHEQNVQSRHHK